MTNEIPELPQFSRDVAVLSGRLPDSERDTDVNDQGVLDPFSGILDLTLERGWVPMLDMSYLALEPLVATDLTRPAGEGSTPRSVSTVPDEAISESPDDDAGEPTVGEVIHGDRDVRHERYSPDLQRLAVEDEGPARTRVDLGQAHRKYRSDPSSDTGPEAPDDIDSTFDAPDLAPRAETGLSERASRKEPGDSNRFDRTRTESATFGPDQTVVDRSGSSVEGTDHTGDGSTPFGSPGSTESGDIVPPRMVTDRAVGDTVRSLDHTGRRGRTQSAGSGPESEGSGGAANGPRMVVERSEDERAGESAPGSEATNPAPSAVGDGNTVGHGLSDGTVSGDEQIAAVVDASTDPESRLVDRLYRSLQERHAIEQRCRGER